MERLTERDAYWLGEEFWTSAREPDDEEIDSIYITLKDYEDAEEQGLLLRLPCKVGDTVYYENPYSTVHTGIQEYQITNIMISQNKKGAWTKKYRAMMLINGKIIDSQINFSFDDIGKTVFLTKEEAEAELEKMKGEEHETD